MLHAVSLVHGIMEGISRDIGKPPLSTLLLYMRGAKYGELYWYEYMSKSMSSSCCTLSNAFPEGSENTIRVSQTIIFSWLPSEVFLFDPS